VISWLKICEPRGRTRDRCDHAWWGSFRGVRVSLVKWTNREIDCEAKADEAFDDLRRAVRNGTFDERGLEPPRDVTPLTFREFADIYKQRHVFAKGLAIGKTIDYRLRPLVDRFGDHALEAIKTADIEDFIADLKQPRMVNLQPNRTLASINRTIEIMRHMMNWAVGRECLDRTLFRRGTEILIRNSTKTTNDAGGGRKRRKQNCKILWGFEQSWFLGRFADLGLGVV
jgi:hypothetical protein